MKPVFFLKELRLNPNLGMLSFLFQRLTGVLLTIYLFAHLYTVGAVAKGEEAFNHSVGKFNNTFGHVIEYLLLLAVVAHMLNGIRIMAGDFLSLTRQNEKLLWVVTIIGIIIAVASIFFFFPHLRATA
jgi:succinate dehydrogenase / fumarate reductase cytochrome b subunit